ncbi:hypothetical protein DB345_05000 [Spartobacteria bacterium LR76]|nr:hypothetical protein DB345_05000 [Spartobacteria bacterium LR76]
MTVAAKKKQVAKFPRGKIEKAVGGILKDFKIHFADASIGKMKIVRVVTPAWKSLRPSVRIGKVLDAVNGKLTPQEQKSILRFSVLTPEEYASVVKNRVVAERGVLRTKTSSKIAAGKPISI